MFAAGRLSDVPTACMLAYCLACAKRACSLQCGTSLGGSCADTLSAQVFLGYLWNPLSWAMEVAALLAIILLDYADFVLIVALLLVNATIRCAAQLGGQRVPSQRLALA